MKKYLVFLSFFLLGVINNAYCQRTDNEQKTMLSKELDSKRIINQFDVKKQNDLVKLMELANNGDSIAMFQLGRSYLPGGSNLVDVDEAIFWFDKSAKLGFSPAFNQLAFIYKLGHTGKIDFEKSYQYFCKAAELENPNGLYLKGYMEYKGFGCNQDYLTAISSFKSGAALGNRGSLYMLGLCHRNGFGVEKNEQLGKDYLQTSAKLGYFPAEKELKHQQPEFDPKATDFIDKINALNRINEKAYFPLNEFTQINSEVNQDDLNGNFSGFIVQYDWSGKQIIKISDLNVKINSEENYILGTWKEEGIDEVLEFTGKFTDGHLFFDEVKQKRTDHYHTENPLTYRFDKSKLTTFYNEELFIHGNINLFALKLKEPQKPTSIFLFKDDGMKPTLNERIPKASILKYAKVFPNPTIEFSNVEFEIKKKGFVEINVLNFAGVPSMKTISNSLDKGRYIVPIELDFLPSGIYYVDLHIDGEKADTLKLIKQ